MRTTSPNRISTFERRPRRGPAHAHRRALLVTSGGYTGPEGHLVQTCRSATLGARNRAECCRPQFPTVWRKPGIEGELASDEVGGRRVALLFMLAVAVTLMWGTCELLVKRHNYQDGRGRDSVLQVAMGVFRR